jgi:hypothetical protein
MEDRLEGRRDLKRVFSQTLADSLRAGPDNHDNKSHHHHLIECCSHGRPCTPAFTQIACGINFASQEFLSKFANAHTFLFTLYFLANISSIK